MFEETETNDYMPQIDMPQIDLDIVEVDHQELLNDRNDQEYEFPLFSFGSTTKNVEDQRETEQDRGRENKRIMKVSLRDVSEERVDNERDPSYYFSSYTLLQKQQFEEMAVSGQQVMERSKEQSLDTYTWKVIDLAKYNQQVDKEIAQDRKKRQQRPGKNKRIGKVRAKERKQERAKIIKMLEKEKQRLIKKKMFHKRGGKKHKKPNAKPVYRTEAN